MFKIRRTEETDTKTFRLPISMLEKMSTLAQQENVSLNSFVVQCCEYAMENFQHSGDEEVK